MTSEDGIEFDEATGRLRRMIRIQRQRTKGWRMPHGAIYVGRPTVFGNPFRACRAADAGYPSSPEALVEYFREWVRGGRKWWDGVESDAARSALLARLPQLANHDLACWCPLHQPCHADALIDLLRPEQRLNQR